MSNLNVFSGNLNDDMANLNVFSGNLTDDIANLNVFSGNLTDDVANMNVFMSDLNNDSSNRDHAVRHLTLPMRTLRSNPGDSTYSSGDSIPNFTSSRCKKRKSSGETCSPRFRRPLSAS